MHAENGFLKCFKTEQEGTFKAQASLSHPFGLNEFEFGSLQNGELTLVADQESHFQRPTVTTDENLKAKQVSYLKRVYKLQGDSLVYDVWMGTGTNEPYHHLHCEMSRQ